MSSLSHLVSAVYRRLQLRRYRGWMVRRQRSSRCLLAYMPTRQQGWILDFLWRDICQELKQIPEIDSGVVSSSKQLKAAVRGRDVYVVALSINDLKAVLDQGFPPERIIFYHTHVRLGVELEKLDLLHGVLVLNGFERELVAMRKVQRRRIHLFPAGFNPELFRMTDSSSPRPIDVLFVGRYRQGKNGYYHQRKRYEFQVNLAERLVQQGLSVAFLGKDWQHCEYRLDSRVQLLDLPHNRYGMIYAQTRLVCSVAGQEGGPVSFLEGLACGCLMVSVPTGFITDLQLAQTACWTLPLLASEQIWAEQIVQILGEHQQITAAEQATRDRYLMDARFSSLAQQLVSICWPCQLEDQTF